MSRLEKFNIYGCAITMFDGALMFSFALLWVFCIVGVWLPALAINKYCADLFKEKLATVQKLSKIHQKVF